MKLLSLHKHKWKVVSVADVDRRNFWDEEDAPMQKMTSIIQQCQDTDCNLLREKEFYGYHSEFIKGMAKTSPRKGRKGA